MLAEGHSSWGANNQICRVLGAERGGPVGTRGSSNRVPIRIQTVSAFRPSQGNTSNRSSKVESPKRRGIRFAEEECHRVNPQSSGSGRVLLNIFRGSEKIRGPTSNFESATSKSIYSQKAFQDGDTAQSHQGSATTRLVSSNRPQRCLSAYTDKQRISEIPKVQVSRASLSIQGPPVRTDVLPSCLHQGPGSSGSIGETGGDTRLSISRRLAHSRQESLSHHSEASEAVKSPETGRVHNKPYKIAFNSHPGFSVRGGEVSDKYQHSELATRQSGQTDTLFKSISSRPISFSQGVPEIARFAGSHDTSSVSVSTTHETHSAVPSVSVENEFQRLGGSNFYQPLPLFTSAVVEGGTEPDERYAIEPECPIRTVDHGCVNSVRMGRALERNECAGQVVSTGVSTPYKHVRDGSSVPFSSPLQTFPSRQGSVSTIRQLHSSNILEQRGRNSIPQSLHEGVGNPEVGKQVSDNSDSRAHSRCPECLGRSAEQDNVVPPRMAVMSDSSTTNISVSRRTTDRSVCQSLQSANGSLLLQGAGSTSIPSGQPGNVMGQSLWVCLPTNLFSANSAAENRTGTLHYSFDCPNVAQTVLVSQNTGPTSRLTSGTTTQGELADPGPRENASPMSTSIETSGMATERQRLLAEGFSEEVVDTLQHSIRSSSSRCYDRMWQVFVRWCQKRSVNPCTCSLSQILAFLQSLVNKGLAYRTIGVYRSAISKFHDLMGGFAVGQHPKVSRFMRGVFLKKPPSRTLFPSWDINVLLKFLRKFPFEPLDRASLESITLKTVILVALASAKRCSDIKALGRYAPYVSFCSGGVRMRTVLGFLTKNANPAHLGEEIYITSLPNDPELCPVRALKFYLNYTNAQMKTSNIKHEHLFVCFGKKNWLKPASVRTISGWIVKTIKAAYAKAKLSIFGSVKAHSTRAQSTSWALFNGTPLEEIMRAADWRCHSTFVRHYARDLWKARPSVTQAVLSGR